MTIETRAPERGGLVVGHHVYAFFKSPSIPAISGTIAEVSQSGTTVIFDVGILSAFGIPRRTTWTWRGKTQSYQPKGDRTQQGVGLAIVQPKGKR